MKTYKTMLSVVLAIMMLVTMIVPAWAASGTNTNDGKITINNAVAGQTYTIYQILKLESYNTETVAYAYKVTDDWKGFVDQKDTDGKDIIKGVYLDIDEQGYVTWHKDVICTSTDSEHKHSDTCYKNADPAAFAKLAQAWAKKHITYDATQKAKFEKTATTTTVEFTGLNLGYYLVDTTLGTLCSLDTTDKEVTIQEKNEVPTVDKLVKEGENWGETNSAMIGDTVEFKTTVHAKKGAKNYVVHDQMGAGLKLNPTSIKVIVNETELAAEGNYTITTTGLTDGCDFEIKFNQTYLDTITANTDIVITYSAVLNKDAEISTGTNDNQTKLDYGDSSQTEWDETKTYTYQFDLVKTDKNNKVLDGAEFELYDAKTDGSKIDLVKVSDGVYRIATDEDKAVVEEGETFESAVIEAGNVTIKGLDANTTYWLEETKAPAGYNKLSARVEFKIEESNLTATFDQKATDTWVSGGVHVINQSGTELPSTGGIGTTIFYCAGAILALGAFVLLVTKKRMGRE